MSHLGFQKLTKMTIFGIFNELLSTQNVNVARFARNVEWDFFELISNTMKKTKKVEFFGGNLSLLSLADSWLKGTKGKFPEGNIFYFSSEMFAVYLSRKKLPNLFTPKGMISDSFKAIGNPMRHTPKEKWI